VIFLTGKIEADDETKAEMGAVDYSQTTAAVVKARVHTHLMLRKRANNCLDSCCDK
jgi:hypothetical protein